MLRRCFTLSRASISRHHFVAATTSCAATELNVTTTASSSSIRLTLASPLLLQARRQCGATSNSNSTGASTPNTTTTEAPPKQQQRMPCTNVGCEKMKRRLAQYSDNDDMYEVFLFNVAKKRGLYEKCRSDFNIDSDDNNDRCNACGCTADEHLTQEILDARFLQRLQEEQKVREQQRQEEQQRRETDKIKHDVIAMIKQHNCETLRWGTTQVNNFLPAALKPWPMVGRSEQFQQVLDLLRQVRTAETPAQRPAMAIFGTPEQGRTRLVFELARSREAVLALVGDDIAKAQDARVFSQKCNSCVFPVDYDLTANRAEQQVAIRILCAAAGIYSSAESGTVEQLVKHLEMTIEQALQFLRDIGTIKADSPTLFCFDWFTSILRRIRADEARAEFYKAFHSALVTKHSTVITTCYGTRQITECAAAAAAVGRRTEFIEMSLARTLQDRRSMLVLHAALIRCAIPPQSSSKANDNNTTQQLPKAQDAADALYFAELLKFSPGVMAHCVNRVSRCFDLDREKPIGYWMSRFGHVRRTQSAGEYLYNVLAIMSADSKQLLAESAAAAQRIDEAEDRSSISIAVRRSLTAEARPVSVVVEPRWVESSMRTEHFNKLKQFARNYVTAPTAEAAAEIRAAAIRSAVLHGLYLQREFRSHLAQLLPNEPLATKQVRDLNDWLDCAPLLVAGTWRRPAVEFWWNACAHSWSTSRTIADDSYPALNSAGWKTSGGMADVERHLSSAPDAADAAMLFVAPEHWNNSNLHQPIIFHEYVAGTDRKRLIQFWVQVKHTVDEPIIDHAEFDKWCLRDPTPPTAAETANTTTSSPAHIMGQLVHLGLRNEILQHPNCIVDHVVHIVLAPVQVKRDGTKIVKRSVDARLGRLKSYSLYVVNPGTPGFENLVSQPVALTMPLMDSHDDADSWMEPVPHDVSKWKDYIGVKRGLSESIRDDKERAVYEKLVADNERQLKEWERGRNA